MRDLFESQVSELQDVYSRADRDGKKTMITAAEKLLYIQNTFAGYQVQRKPVLRIAGYVASGLAVVCVILLAWVYLINPALLRSGTTPLVMVRIITTALIGAFCLSFGFVGFLQRRIPLRDLFFLVAAGLGCIDPGILTDLIGVFIAAIIVVQLLQKNFSLYKKNLAAYF